MKLATISVARPVLTTMVTLIVVVLGIVSLLRVRIDLLPAVELPTVTIRTEYEGASPEVIEQRVTAIIEEIVATVPGVQRLESTSAEGRSDVKATFGWGIDVDTAAIDVDAKIEGEIDELPDDIVRPRVSKFDVASFPVVILGISSALPPVELTTLVEERIRQRLAQLPGVAQVDPWGSYDREVRVELDPDRLRAFEVPIEHVRQALIDANLDLPAGKIEQGQQAVTLRAPAQFTDLEQIRELVVATHDGAPVKLRQLGRVLDTYTKLERVARVNGRLGLRMGIRKQANANTVEVSQAILREVEAINRDYPQVKVVPVTDQGNFIERSIQNVARSVLYGGGLAVLVLLLFLRSLRSTAVIAVSIPISLVATFAMLYFGGLTLNLMTLGGLALGVGMMVDNSIVVLENVFRRRDELCEDATEAAVAGTAEVGPAIVASTITTLVVFLPLVFVRGVTGVLFQDLALVILFSLGCSLVVSLSLVPMLASRLLLPRPSGPNVRTTAQPDGALGRVLDGMAGSYGRLLSAALRHRAATVVIALAALGASVVLAPVIGTEFLPPSDEGEVRVTGKMPVGTKLEVVDRQTKALERAVFEAVPEATASVTSVSTSGRDPNEAFRGEVRLTLRPAGERERSNSEIASALRKDLDARIPGMEIRTRAPQGQFLLERVLGTTEGLTVEVRGYDLEVLARLAQQAAAVATEVPGVTDVELSREAGVPQARIHIDRAKAADLGLSPSEVARTLELAMAGAEAGEYHVEGNAFRILVQLADAEHLSLERILDLRVRNDRGQDVALRSVVSTDPGLGPILIERKGQERLVRIQANVAGRDLGSVAADVEQRLVELPRPAGYALGVAGTFEEQERAFGELLVSLLLSLVLVYMVLAAQYESLRDPLVVMLSVPVAAIGVVLVLVLTETTLNVQSFIGCIMLGGIVVNNAILLVDQAARLQAEGASVHAAVIEAGRRRLRPILMTTLTTVLALVPLALGVGEGADAQAPLARAVLGGLAASTLITLVLIPVVYSLMHRDRRGPG
ncbi:efflux RND transporter permease subunit [Paraliomyxa miuraensis]|uniref:efflux RND transporter permease subunit n=1 Tax=Paraliomyxa miuraensis TaxID=376150 RepID=UPI002253F9AA|nr:efflux RND transporter permease subunit [Paraliomyxa miuraensis]MCX4247139.1 efflux RND transporter permease subunit [Paraliomyxa miuraensis]